MSGKGSDEKSMIVSSKEISLILGVRDSRIRQLTNEKALMRVSHGKYDLPASVQTYVDYRLNKEKVGDELDKTTEEAL